MIDKVKFYIKKDVRYKELLKVIVNNPLINKNNLLEKLNIKIIEVDKLLNNLSKDMIILELTGPQDSNIESRVPKTIYTINPEIEDEISSLL